MENRLLKAFFTLYLFLMQEKKNLRFIKKYAILHVSTLHRGENSQIFRKEQTKNLHVYLIRRALIIPNQLFIVATPNRNICSLSCLSLTNRSVPRHVFILYPSVT